MVNSRHGKELFTLVDNVGTRTNGCNLAMNKFRLEAREILAIKLVNFLEQFFNTRCGGKNIAAQAI